MESLEPRGYIHDEYQTAMRQNMAKKMAEKFQEGGFQGFSEYLFEVFNIDARYEKDAKDEDRQKLNKEAGLIIANHPGGIDTPAILKTLTRDSIDLKIVISQRGYDVYGNVLDKIFLSQFLMVAVSLNAEK